MILRKILIAVLVVAAGSTVSYFIVKNAASPLAPVDKRQPLLGVSGPLRWKNNIISTSSMGFYAATVDANNKKDNSQNINNINAQATNLTNFVAGELFNNLNKLDQSGQEALRGFDPNSPQGKELVQDILKNLQDPASFFASPVEIKNLKISQDNSKAALMKYLTAVNNISENRFAGFNKRAVDVAIDVVQNNEVASAKQFADIQDKIAHDYLDLTAPSDLINYHKNLIEHFRSAAFVFQALSDYLNDPIKAQLAAQMVEQLEANFEANQSLLTQKLKEMGY